MAQKQTSKEIKPGDRCIIIFSHCGDEGKIVVVERYFDPANELWAEQNWTDNCRLLVTSLGSLLHGVLSDRVEPIYTYRTRPYPPAWLRKLPEINEKQKILEVVQPS